MNVLHVLWSFEFGGIQRLVIDLCREQKKTGMKPMVLVGRASGNMKDQFDALDIPIFDATLKNGFDPGLFVSAEVKSGISKADIVHIHSYSPASSRLAAKIGCPIIYTDHGNYGFGRNRNWRDRFKFKLQARFFKSHIAHMTFNSRFTRDTALEYFNLDDVTKSVVYNGIDLSQNENPDELSGVDLPAQAKGKFIVGTSSRFAGFKRIDRLISAFAAMESLDDCCLLLVGDGPLRADYEKQTEELGIADRVIFTGFCKNVRDYQNAMDVCVFPSCGEPFGLVAIETLNLGKPTLALRDGGGIAEIITPLDPDDVVDGEKELARRLDEYYHFWKEGSPEKSIRSKDRRHHAGKFDIKNMAAKFGEIYDSCLH